MKKSITNEYKHVSNNLVYFQVVECLLGAIGNLCAINESYKLQVYQHGAIELLTPRLSEYVATKMWKILEPSLVILKCLTNKNLQIENMRNQTDFIRATSNPHSGPLHELKPCLMLDAVPRSILKVAIQLVRSLAQIPENHQLLREQQYVNQILTITTHLHQELVRIPTFRFLTF